MLYSACKGKGQVVPFLEICFLLVVRAVKSFSGKDRLKPVLFMPKYLKLVPDSLKEMLDWGVPFAS